MAKCMSEGSDGELPREDEEPTSGIESSEFYTPTMSASSATNSTPSSSCSAYQSSRIDSLQESRSAYKSAVEFEIAASKSHWTEWDSDSDDEPDCSLEDNLQHFESLQLNYRWGRHDRAYFEKHDLVVGKKLAEGGHAEIYEATLVGFGRSLVVKVFKEGSSVRSLERRWPPEMLAKWKRNKATFFAIFRNPLLLIEGAILLNDERFNNRFAFVMRRAWGDLRKHIDLQMLNCKHKRGGAPYSTNKAVSLMWRIAQDMAWLHEQGILHRDLKASNVLIWMDSIFSEVGQFHGRVADFECSVGVVGTRFWRAPEILQQLKDGISMSKVVFTTKADVYSFGMTCYEIVTGCIPFEDLSWQNYDHVLSGNQLALPADLDMLVQKMIHGCWQLDPQKRPSFSEILNEFKSFEDRVEVDYFYL